MSLGAAWGAAMRGPGRIRLGAFPVLVALAALVAVEPPWTARLQSGWLDAYQALLPRRIVSMPATIVEIDQKSLAALGQWPWPRWVLARLIDTVNRHQPAAIGIDIFMPEADRFSPERLLVSGRDTNPARARELAALPSNDAELARALAAAPAVLTVVGMDVATGMPLRAAPFSVVDLAPRTDVAAPARRRLPHYAGVLASLDQLDRAARGRGLISVETAGGSVRRVALAASVEGTLVPALAIELWRVATGAPSMRLLADGASIKALEVGGLVAATEEDGGVRIYYSPHDSDRFVSAIDVLDGRFDVLQLQRKLVLIGVTGVGMVDERQTPLGVSMPGVEIHAQLLENLYDGTLLRRPGWAAQAEAIVFLLLGGMLFATPRWKPRHAALLAFGCVAVLVATGFVMFRTQRLLFDAATPGLGLIALFGVLLVLTLADAIRQKKSLERVVQLQREASARIAGELEAAKRIQTGTLPRADLLRDDRRLDLAATMVPAREVGGDLYDFFRLDDRRLFFLVGDVAGKGLSASIFMAVSKALCKSTMLRAPSADLGGFMAAANAEVSRDNPETLFVTAFAGVLDLESGELAYCNAGHDNPYLTHPAEAGIRRIDDGGGPPLCAIDDFAYRGGRCRLRPGSQHCLVTDGVTEAQDPTGAMYGAARVQSILLGLPRGGVTARAVVDALRADVDAFAAGAEAADDLTILVLRWDGPPARG